MSVTFGTAETDQYLSLGKQEKCIWRDYGWSFSQFEFFKVSAPIIVQRRQINRTDACRQIRKIILWDFSGSESVGNGTFTKYKSDLQGADEAAVRPEAWGKTASSKGKLSSVSPQTLKCPAELHPLSRGLSAPINQLVVEFKTLSRRYSDASNYPSHPAKEGGHLWGTCRKPGAPWGRNAAQNKEAKTTCVFRGRIPWRVVKEQSSRQMLGTIRSNKLRYLYLYLCISHVSRHTE